ncbi:MULTISPECIES: F0F1 ATP synthase subunit delta [unclassified Legionella]|uniref:F0F1 ATP synthase subunit delta n=1 Tax=unclassified Legionella TaxID=2622702 RepID=UPI001055E20B|nr:MULTISPECIES: F0F1 ATP synthase subunit delta [unclassified Legionella]MDI9818011.1 F0F1 ATP synthase subunit delta [Legionella sp. PL877]
MPDTTTIARPYAKATFEYALAANKLSQWSKILNTLALLVMDEEVSRFINNPAATEGQQIELLMTSFPETKEKADSQAIKNLVSLLANNRRLMLLPDIKVLFEVLRAEQEKTLTVNVISFSELSAAQQAQLKESLSQRLKRQVTLNVSIDKSLLGGAVIQAGDLVIDGSVRGQLDKLGADIAA